MTMYEVREVFLKLAFCKELLLSAASEGRDTMLPLMRKEE